MRLVVGLNMHCSLDPVLVVRIVFLFASDLSRLLYFACFRCTGMLLVFRFMAALV